MARRPTFKALTLPTWCGQDGSASPTPVAATVVEATTFDPKTDGGDASENDKRAARAIDGNARHRHPSWLTYRMPLRTSRMSYFRGRPPGFTGGMSGAISRHWVLVRSLG